ncbi:MAG: hypothetical protein ACPIOQ_55960 [Promethearchaeia archaeon]
MPSPRVSRAVILLWEQRAWPGCRITERRARRPRAADGSGGHDSIKAALVGRENAAAARDDRDTA